MSLSYSMEFNAVATFSFVDLNPFLCLFMWPLSVAGDVSGRYLLTAFVVNPGHVGN
jgi:hypothetical protein